MSNKKNINKKQANNNDNLDNININKINDPKKEREKIQYQIIKEVFELYDTSKNGFIYGTDFKILLKTLDIQIKKKEIAILLKENFNKDLNN